MTYLVSTIQELDKFNLTLKKYNQLLQEDDIKFVLQFGKIKLLKTA